MNSEVPFPIPKKHYEENEIGKWEKRKKTEKTWTFKDFFGKNRLAGNITKPANGV